MRECFKLKVNDYCIYEIGRMLKVFEKVDVKFMKMEASNALRSTYK